MQAIEDDLYDEWCVMKKLYILFSRFKERLTTEHIFSSWIEVYSGRFDELLYFNTKNVNEINMSHINMSHIELMNILKSKEYKKLLRTQKLKRICHG